MSLIPSQKMPDDLSTPYIVAAFNSIFPQRPNIIAIVSQSLDDLRGELTLGHLCRKDFSIEELHRMQLIEESETRYMGLIAIKELYDGKPDLERLDDLGLSLSKADTLQSRYLAGGLLGLFFSVDPGPAKSIKQLFSEWFVQIYEEWEASLD